MILYNITFQVENSVVELWLSFMKDDYLPMIHKTGYIESYKILKLLNDEYAQGGTTYSVQLMLDNLDQLSNYQALYEESLEANLHQRFEGKFVYFKTWLQEIV